MIVYHIYKDNSFHSKAWGVSHFIEDLKGYYKDVSMLTPSNGEYLRIHADESIYTIYTQYMGMIL